MPKDSPLLKAIKLSAYLIVAFDRYFRRPYDIERATPKKWHPNSYYLIRQKLIDENYQLLKRVEEPISLITKPWDRRWRLVAFDIREKNRHFRDKLRGKLKELGFQKLQRSAWISPLPVEPFILNLAKASEKGATIFLFEGKIKEKEPHQLIKDLWPIDEWAEEANKLIAEINRRDSVDDKTKALFWQLLIEHPLVPLDLLPQPWPLEKLISVFTSHLRQS